LRRARSSRRCVEALDLADLGFDGVQPLATGQPELLIITRLGSFTHNMSWRCGFLTQRLDTLFKNV
jgi:hypothetical protein